MTTPQLLFSDNASTSLAAPITSTATSCSVLAGTGALFPQIGANQAFIFTFVKNGTPTVFEVALCTGLSGDTFTSIQRNYEGTQGALSWNAGDYVNLYPTAGGLNSFLQPVTAQAGQYNFALDTGTANNYVVTVSPASGTLVNGQRFRWIAAHTNTAGCTFNGLSLYLPNGAAVTAGTIVAGGYYEAVYDGANYYQLFGATAAPNYNNVALTGVPTAPTAPGFTDTTQLATTQFVMGQFAATTGSIRTGAFNCINGTTTVTFPNAFPTVCYAVFVQWEFASTVGYVVPNSYQAGTGFQYTNASAGLCVYLAIGN